MSMPLAFWLCMALWLILGGVPLFKTGERSWQGAGVALLPFLAVALIGWHVFGAPVRP